MDLCDDWLLTPGAQFASGSEDDVHSSATACGLQLDDGLGEAVHCCFDVTLADTGERKVSQHDRA